MPGVIGGLPYPVGTDLVVDGDNAIQALARAVDRNPNMVSPGNLIPITYGAGWAATGSGLRYSLINGWVWLNGRAVRASGSSTTIGNVPSTIAPLPTFWVPVNGGGVIAISNGGAITLDSGIAAGAFNLFVSVSWPLKPLAAAGTEADEAAQQPDFSGGEDG